jgi:TolA-binding protein
MLALLGHKEMAVEVMRLYIHNNEHTQGARLKLVQWLIQLQQRDEALAQLEQVLADNPDNQAALGLKASLQS